MKLKEVMETAGVDYETTLNRFSGNEGLLERFVRKFPGDPTFEALKAAVLEKQYNEVERSAHTLKGIAANLGFQHLSDLNAEVVALIRSNAFSDSPVCEAFARVSEEYSKVIDCLGRLD